MASGRVDAPEPTAERTGERAVEEAQALEVFFRPSEARKERILSCLRAGAWLARWLGARALAARGEPSAIPDLTPLLDDKDWWVRRAAVEAIGELAPRGNPAAARDALERALADRDLGVRVWAVRGLWRLEAGGVTEERSPEGRHG